MKKTLLIAALASAALVSCSKVQVVEIPQDEIKFSVVADNATKAAHVYGTNNLMSSFTVYADYDTDSAEPIEYISGDEMTVISASEINYAANVTRYWPATVNATNTMTFYAIADGEIAGGRTAGTAPTVTGFAIPGEVEVAGTVNETNAMAKVTGQKDLLYAVKTVTGRDAPVALNFRHALSLIEFKARCTNTTLKVTVTGVKVGNVKHTADFSFPTVVTDGRIDETTEDDVTELSTGVGSWSNHENITARHEYVATFTETSALSAVATDLTYRNPSAINSENNSMLLLPQTLNDPWDGNTLSGNTTGAYIAVKCTISNVGANSTYTQLYSGWAYMPLGAAAPSPTWEPGKKYVYTFVFGTGNAGYDENGDPVLAPIDYTVTVDDFDAFTGGNTEVDME